MDPVILKIELMLQDLLLLCTTDDGASWRPPAELAHRSLKGSYDIYDQMRHSCNRDPLGDPCGIIADLVYCHNPHVLAMNKILVELYVSSASLLPMIQVVWSAFDVVKHLESGFFVPYVL